MSVLLQRLRHVGNGVGHYRHGGDAKGQVRWVDLVERVGMCVVNVEVMRAVYVKARTDYTSRMIGPMSAPLPSAAMRSALVMASVRVSVRALDGPDKQALQIPPRRITYR
ncbi:MAG TPA: hypothetical protein VMZ30_18300 [Pyrinomonadaceae bacterium]|nr:hypothetical protein [Pyrinomonadaceae bacterium]